MSEERFPIAKPVNIMAEVAEEFLRGAPFTEQLCDRIIASFCEETTGNYKKRLEFVKKIFDNSKRQTIGTMIYEVETDFVFDNVEVALMIRLLNLCHHGERILVVNKKIVFIPVDLRFYTEDSVRLFVGQNVKAFKPAVNQSWLTRWLGRSIWKPIKEVKLPANYSTT